MISSFFTVFTVYQNRSEALVWETQEKAGMAYNLYPNCGKARCLKGQPALLRLEPIMRPGNSGIIYSFSCVYSCEVSSFFCESQSYDVFSFYRKAYLNIYLLSNYGQYFKYSSNLSTFPFCLATLTIWLFVMQKDLFQRNL